MTHRSMEELLLALPDITSAPAEGPVSAIVIREDHGLRAMVDTADMSLARGMHGDHWERGCWRSTEDGRPHPDVQVCMMPARAIAVIAGDMPNWAAAGDNLFIDMDLSPGNCPPGTRLAMGTAEVVITDQPHNGCQSFIDSYGRDACVFVNTGAGKELRLRGIYGRVIRDGRVSVGDIVRKIG